MSPQTPTHTRTRVRYPPLVHMHDMEGSPGDRSVSPRTEKHTRCTATERSRTDQPARSHPHTHATRSLFVDEKELPDCAAGVGTGRTAKATHTHTPKKAGKWRSGGDNSHAVWEEAASRSAHGRRRLTARHHVTLTHTHTQAHLRPRKQRRQQRRKRRARQKTRERNPWAQARKKSS